MTIHVAYVILLVITGVFFGAGWVLMVCAIRQRQRELDNTRAAVAYRYTAKDGGSVPEKPSEPAVVIHQLSGNQLSKLAERAADLLQTLDSTIAKLQHPLFIGERYTEADREQRDPICEPLAGDFLVRHSIWTFGSDKGQPRTDEYAVDEVTEQFVVYNGDKAVLRTQWSKLLRCADGERIEVVRKA